MLHRVACRHMIQDKPLEGSPNGCDDPNVPDR